MAKLSLWCLKIVSKMSALLMYQNRNSRQRIKILRISSPGALYRGLASGNDFESVHGGSSFRKCFRTGWRRDRDCMFEIPVGMLMKVEHRNPLWLSFLLLLGGRNCGCLFLRRGMQQMVERFWTFTELVTANSTENFRNFKTTPCLRWNPSTTFCVYTFCHFSNFFQKIFDFKRFSDSKLKILELNFLKENSGS
jgi:hypothetical protein